MESLSYFNGLKKSYLVNIPPTSYTREAPLIGPLPRPIPSANNSAQTMLDASQQGGRHLNRPLPKSIPSAKNSAQTMLDASQEGGRHLNVLMSGVNSAPPVNATSP